MMRVAWALLAVLVFVAVPRLGAEEVKIIGWDFAFDAPAMLGASMTTFVFENSGDVRHEMIIVLLRQAVTEQHIKEAHQGGITLGNSGNSLVTAKSLASFSLSPARAVLGSS